MAQTFKHTTSIISFAAFLLALSWSCAVNGQGSSTATSNTTAAMNATMNSTDIGSGDAWDAASQRCRSVFTDCCKTPRCMDIEADGFNATVVSYVEKCGNPLECNPLLTAKCTFENSVCETGEVESQPGDTNSGAGCLTSSSASPLTLVSLAAFAVLGALTR